MAWRSIPHRGPDHRRLHGPGGDPSGRSAMRPVLSGEEIDRNAETYQRAGLQGARPGAHRGPPQRRVARHAGRGPVPAGPHGHGRPAPRARRLREALRGAAADLGARAALPAAAGLRLGGDQGGRRARRHRPDVQPAARRARSSRPTAWRRSRSSRCRSCRAPTASSGCRSRRATTWASTSRPRRSSGRSCAFPTR